MAGRGRGGAGKVRGRGRGDDAADTAKARRTGAKGSRNLGDGRKDSELLVLGEASPPPQRSSASLSGGGGSDAIDVVNDLVPEAQRHRDGGRGRGADASDTAKARRTGAKGGRNLADVGKDSELLVLGEASPPPQRSSASLSGVKTGVRERNGPATDAVKDGMVGPHVDLEIDGQQSEESEVQVITQDQLGTRSGAIQNGADADERNGGPATDVNNELLQQPNSSEADEEEVINKGLEELENLCFVLGMSYEKKLLEFGLKLDIQRLDKSIDVLRTTLANNFSQLQIAANELMNSWKAADTPYERMSKFAWTLAVRDVTGPESVTGKGYLATSWIVRASKEARSIQEEATRKIRDRYLRKKKKLMKILAESHLVPLDVEFDPHKTVNPDQYHEEKGYLKECIRKAKKLVRDRKELVLRVELVQNCLKNKASVPFCSALIEDARRTVLKMRESPDEEIMFDGVAIDDAINGLEGTWYTLQSELEEAALKRNVEVKSKTRSGRVPHSSN